MYVTGICEWIQFDVNPYKKQIYWIYLFDYGLD